MPDKLAALRAKHPEAADVIEAAQAYMADTGDDWGESCRMADALRDKLEKFGRKG